MVYFNDKEYKAKNDQFGVAGCPVLRANYRPLPRGRNIKIFVWPCEAKIVPDPRCDGFTHGGDGNTRDYLGA